MRVVLAPKLPRNVTGWVIHTAWVVGGATLLGIVFVAAFFTAMRVEMRSTEIEVPDLVGMKLERARDHAGTLDLVLEVVDQRNDPRIASGRVLEQMPPAGSLVRRGRKMKLILSLGGKVLEVPDLVGHAARAVAIELRQEGLIPGDEAHVHSYDMAAGRVLAQVPPAEAKVVPNSRIYRLISDGPPPVSWVMPDLRGRSRREVEDWIALCGFRRGEMQRIPGGDRAPGTVMAQRPQAGYPIRSKDIVELVVAD